VSLCFLRRSSGTGSFVLSLGFEEPTGLAGSKGFVVRVVVVLCFVKSRNGLLVRLWFFFFETNIPRVGGVHIYIKYVASFFVCESEEFFLSGCHQEEPVAFFCVVDFFCSSRQPRSLSRSAELGGDLERRSFSFVLLEGEGFVDFAPEVL
jgi:hypothetical protein